MNCQADDVTAIVIDPGSSYTKVGYSGDLTPKFVLPSVYGKVDDLYIFGEEVNVVNKGKEIFSPMADGCVQDWNAMSKIWNWIYEEKLAVSASEQPLIVTQPCWNNLENQQRAVEVVFEDLQVPIFSMVNAPVCVAYTTPRSMTASGLIIDIGSAVASVTSIIDGHIVEKASSHTRFAGDFLNVNIMKYFESLGITPTPSYQVKQRAHAEPGQPANNNNLYNFSTTESFHNYQLSQLLTEFKESCLQVHREVQQQQIPYPAGMRTFEFPTGYNLPFGPDRYKTTEPLFKPLESGLLEENTSTNQIQGLTDMILNALSKTPQHTSGNNSTLTVLHKLLANIVITGGTGRLSDLPQRIEKEIAFSFQKLQVSLSIDYKLNAAWQGASIIGSMGNYHQPHWISKQEYDEIGAGIVETRFKI